MTLIDNLIKKADELNLPTKAEQALRQADTYLHKAIEKAGQTTHDNQDKVTAFLDKAGRTIDEKTQGKYHSTVTKVRTQVDKGIVKLADQRPSADTWATGTEGSGNWAGSDSPPGATGNAGGTAADTWNVGDGAVGTESTTGSTSSSTPPPPPRDFSG